MCIGREISKKFEEYKLSRIEDLDIENITLKGEFVLLLEGGVREKDSLSAYREKILALLSQGLKTKDVVKEIKNEASLSKNEIYEYVLELNNEKN